jgi:hypothetical protein
MSDPLDRAARALREAHDGASPAAASTRSRILGVTALRKRRRRVFAAVWMPLAAVLVVSSAWAAVTGRIPRLVAILRGAPAATTMTTRPARATGETPEARSPDALPPTPTARPAETLGPAASAPANAPAASAVASAAAPSIARAAVSASAVATATTPSTTTASSGRARRDLEESLYSAAHQAHFVARDPAAALRAWDEYLTVYPNGRFAPEARYNRALALVRLGRADDARAALAPFADGRSGGYRQTEARALLDALDAGP